MHSPSPMAGGPRPAPWPEALAGGPRQASGQASGQIVSASGHASDQPSPASSQQPPASSPTGFEQLPPCVADEVPTRVSRALTWLLSQFDHMPENDDVSEVHRHALLHWNFSHTLTLATGLAAQFYEAQSLEIVCDILKMGASRADALDSSSWKPFVVLAHHATDRSPQELFYGDIRTFNLGPHRDRLMMDAGLVVGRHRLERALAETESAQPMIELPSVSFAPSPTHEPVLRIPSRDTASRQPRPSAAERPRPPSHSPNRRSGLVAATSALITAAHLGDPVADESPQPTDSLVPDWSEFGFDVEAWHPTGQQMAPRPPSPSFISDPSAILVPAPPPPPITTPIEEERDDGCGRRAQQAAASSAGSAGSAGSTSSWIVPTFHDFMDDRNLEGKRRRTE